MKNELTKTLYNFFISKILSTSIWFSPFSFLLFFPFWSFLPFLFQIPLVHVSLPFSPHFTCQIFPCSHWEDINISWLTDECGLARKHLPDENKYTRLQYIYENPDFCFKWKCILSYVWRCSLMCSWLLSPIKLEEFSIKAMLSHTHTHTQSSDLLPKQDEVYYLIT